MTTHLYPDFPPAVDAGVCADIAELSNRLISTIASEMAEAGCSTTEIRLMRRTIVGCVVDFYPLAFRGGSL